MSHRSGEVSQQNPCRRFIRRVHLRLTLLRLLEGAGAGCLVGSLLALVLIPLLFWHGASDLLIPIYLCMTLGMVGGFLRAWRLRPSRLEAAVQIDQQLDLQDLLSTALLVSNTSDDAWHRSIVNLANARCAQLNNAPLVLRRLGARGWGAISLMATLALTLAFLAASTSQMHAADVIEQARLARQQVDEPANHPLLVVAADGSVRRPSVPAEAEDIGHNNPNEDTAQSAAPTDQTPRNTPAEDRPKTDQPGASNIIPETSGARGARTQVRQTQQPKPHEVQGTPTAPAPDPRALRTAAGGAPADTKSDTRQPDPSAVTGPVAGNAAAPNTHPTAVPPWQTDQWPTDIGAARQALQDDRIAPVFHDIVRDYFQPNP